MYETVVTKVLRVPFTDKYKLIHGLGKSNFKATDLQEIHMRLFKTTLDRSLGKLEMFNELLFSIQNYCKTVTVHEEHVGIAPELSVLQLPHVISLTEVQKTKIMG